MAMGASQRLTRRHQRRQIGGSWENSDVTVSRDNPQPQNKAMTNALNGNTRFATVKSASPNRFASIPSPASGRKSASVLKDNTEPMPSSQVAAAATWLLGKVSSVEYGSTLAEWAEAGRIARGGAAGSWLVPEGDYVVNLASGEQERIRVGEPGSKGD